MYRNVTKRFLLQIHNGRLQNSNLSSCRFFITHHVNNPNGYNSNPINHTLSKPYLDFKSKIESSKPHEEEEEEEEEEEAQSDTHNHQRRTTEKFDYKEEEARLLRASLPHVVKFGWSESAMIAGAREVGVSPSIVGSFPQKEAALVEFFMDDCLQRLVDRINLGEDLENLTPSERVAKLLRIRLEMQIPYVSKWPQALSIQSQPMNLPTSFKQRAILVDEIWHAAGDEASDSEWYVKRTVLGGIYSTTEIYMLTDSSPGFRDTWAFMSDRVKDVFEIKTTFQEAKYLAEAFSAGMGSSLQGLVGRVFP